MSANIKDLARAAADIHAEAAKPLTAAVVDVVNGAGLNDEQTRRVVEEANVIAFLDAFKKAGPRKNVVFEGGPADPEVVLSQTGKGDLEMVRSNKKMASAPVQVRGCEPVDPGTKYAMLSRSTSLICNKLYELESMYESAARQLADATKLAMAAGWNEGQVLSAVRISAQTNWGARVAEHEVRSRTGITGEYAKTAGRLVVDHPVVLSTRSVEQLAYALRTAKQAAKLADAELREFVDEVWRSACKR